MSAAEPAVDPGSHRLAADRASAGHVPDHRASIPLTDAIDVAFGGRTALLARLATAFACHDLDGRRARRTVRRRPGGVRSRSAPIPRAAGSTCWSTARPEFPSLLGRRRRVRRGDRQLRRRRDRGFRPRLLAGASGRESLRVGWIAGRARVRGRRRLRRHQRAMSSPLSAILGLTVTRDGELFVGSPQGIARFSRDVGVAGNEGQFYTRTLDNGTDRDESWHRLDLARASSTPAAPSMSITHPPNDAVLARRSRRHLRSKRRRRPTKVSALEAVLGDRWTARTSCALPSSARRRGAIRTGASCTPMSHSVLFRSQTSATSG